MRANSSVEAINCSTLQFAPPLERWASQSLARFGYNY